MAMNNHGGKGSASRPLGVTREQFSNNFDAIFGKKKESKPQTDEVVTLELDGTKLPGRGQTKVEVHMLNSDIQSELETNNQKSGE